MWCCWIKKYTHTHTFKQQFGDHKSWWWCLFNWCSITFLCYFFFHCSKGIFKFSFSPLGILHLLFCFSLSLFYNASRRWRSVCHWRIHSIPHDWPWIYRPSQARHSPKNWNQSSHQDHSSQTAICIAQDHTGSRTRIGCIAAIEPPASD